MSLPDSSAHAAKANLYDILEKPVDELFEAARIADAPFLHNSGLYGRSLTDNIEENHRVDGEEYHELIRRPRDIIAARGIVGLSIAAGSIPKRGQIQRVSVLLSHRQAPKLSVRNDIGPVEDPQGYDLEKEVRDMIAFFRGLIDDTVQLRKTA